MDCPSPPSRRRRHRRSQQRPSSSLPCPPFGRRLKAISAGLYPAVLLAYPPPAPAIQRKSEDVGDLGHELELQALARRRGNVLQTGLVAARRDHPLDARALCRERLLLEAADGQH